VGTLTALTGNHPWMSNDDHHSAEFDLKVAVFRNDMFRRFPASGSVAVQVGLFPTTRLCEAFERQSGISPKRFREMK
jgi:hypothetical protein